MVDPKDSVPLHGRPQDQLGLLLFEPVKQRQVPILIPNSNLVESCTSTVFIFHQETHQPWMLRC